MFLEWEPSQLELLQRQQAPLQGARRSAQSNPPLERLRQVSLRHAVPLHEAPVPNAQHPRARSDRLDRRDLLARSDQSAHRVKRVRHVSLESDASAARQRQR